MRIEFTPEAGGFDHGCLRKAVLGQLVTEPYSGASRVARVEVTRADMRHDVADPYANMSAQHRIVMIGESTPLAE